MMIINVNNVNNLFREVKEFNSYTPADSLKELKNFVIQYATSDDERVSDSLKRIELLIKELEEICQDDEVTITCYGNTRVWNSRNEAIKFYKKCYLSSEGSEQQRYANILFELNSGNKHCFI